MAQNVKLPLPRQLAMSETLESLDHFKSSAKNFYRRSADFKSFFRAGTTWNRATANFGLADADQVLAVDRADNLECLLVAISGHVPFPYLTKKILNDTRNIEDVFKIIYDHYQVSPTPMTFLDFAKLRRQNDESPLTFYE